MFQNYAYDGTLKQIAKEQNENAGSTDTSNKTGAGYDEFENILQNQQNILADTPNQRYDARMALGDPESADIRIVGLGYSGCGNSCLMLRLFYNEYDDEPEDNELLQWEQHQMQYKFENDEEDLLRISYFDLKGFDDIITKNEMNDRIRDTINHSFNVILLYYSIDERISFVDSNGYSVQDIKTYVEYWMTLLDTKKFMLILVGNKLDLENDGERMVSTTEGQNVAKSWGNIPFIEVSAKTGQNIKQLLDIICYIYTRRFEEIDGDLNEAALFDEDKCDKTKTVVKEDEEYEEYVEEKEVESFEQIMIQQNQLNAKDDEIKQDNYDDQVDDDKKDEQKVEVVTEINNDKLDQVHSTDEKNKLDHVDKKDEQEIEPVITINNDDKLHEVVSNDEKNKLDDQKYEEKTAVEATTDKLNDDTDEVDDDKKEEMTTKTKTVSDEAEIIINNDDKLDEVESKSEIEVEIETKQELISVKIKRKVKKKKKPKKDIEQEAIPIKKKKALTPKKDIKKKKELTPKKQIKKKKVLTSKKDIKKKKELIPKKEIKKKKALTPKKDIKKKKELTPKKEIKKKKALTPKKEIKKKKSEPKSKANKGKTKTIKKTVKIPKKSKGKVIPIKKTDKTAIKKKKKPKTISTTIKAKPPPTWTPGGPSVVSFFDAKPIPRKPRPKNNMLSKQVMSVKEFNDVPLKNLIVDDDTLQDNYDIAKKICKFYDSQFGDTDTVCVVAEKGKQPSISFFCKGNYVRKHKNIAGKHILVYRACKHQPAKEPIYSKQEFENAVKKISIQHEKSDVNTICDVMDKKFGLGCHYARSTTKKPRYDIYSRFSDRYDCGFKLPSGAYVIAWRR